MASGIAFQDGSSQEPLRAQSDKIAEIASPSSVRRKQRKVPAMEEHRSMASSRNEGYESRSDPLLDRRTAPLLLSGSATQTIQWYPPPSRPYTRRELLADQCVNFLGAFMAWVAAPGLCVVSWLAGDPLTKLAGFAAFGIGLVAMLTFSAQYHYLCWDWTIKHLRHLDHIGINLMIMGTYTPFTQQWDMYSILTFVWVLGLIGVAIEVWRMSGGGKDADGSEDTRKPLDNLNLVRYLLMGWAVLGVTPAMLRELPTHQWLTMLVGGLLFTVGVPFFLRENLEFHVPIWHGFVILASFCFFIAQLELIGKSPQSF